MIAPRKREWPKFATSPDGGCRARFDCAGDVHTGWIVDGMTEPLKPLAEPVTVAAVVAASVVEPPRVKRAYVRKVK